MDEIEIETLDIIYHTSRTHKKIRYSLEAQPTIHFFFNFLCCAHLASNKRHQCDYYYIRITNEKNPARKNIEYTDRQTKTIII